MRLPPCLPLPSSRSRALRAALASAAVLAGLAACGGGSSVDGPEPVLSSQTAQGYAADAQAMPLTAASTLQIATLALEAGLQRHGPGPAAVGLTVPCANGGSLSFVITGASSSQRLNGVFDAGETYTVSFDHCGHLDDHGVLDGSLTLTVTAYSSSQADLSHSAQALRLTSSQGRYTLQGAVREQRSSTPLPGGGLLLASRLSSAGIGLQSEVGGRSSIYELRGLDWHVACTFDGSGRLVRRTHQGTLTLAASTPRRPNATLQVATQGTLVAADDGLYAAQGSFSLATPHDRIAVSYGSTAVTLELDLGNDGSIDSRWTVPQVSFDSQAG